VRRRALGLAAGLLAFVALAGLGSPLGAAGSPAAFAAATTALMVAWWASAALPLWATALAPLVVFPLAGVHAGTLAERARAAAGPYADAYVLLFLGGMAIAAALQETGLHRRLATAVLARVGASSGRFVLGVLLATASVSLGISNTAAAALMLPIALAVVAEVETRAGPRPRCAAALVLAVAWGANLGGLGTKIGTATNAQLAGFLAARGVDVSFVRFSLLGLGLLLLLVPVAAWLLAWIARDDAPDARALAEVRELRSALGPWSAGERAVLAVFAGTALAWILAQPIRDALVAAGARAGVRTAHVEASAALAAAALLAVLRPGGRRVLTARSLRAMPFSALLLIGGSFALASGIEASGLADAARPQLARLAGLPPFAQVLAASLATVAVSAFASNTATVGILLPILAAAVTGGHQTPALVAAGFASSCDFALPAGTPPNAIAFASGRVPFATMLRAGVALDVVAGVLVALWCWLAVPRLLG
jgi:sodium-dependent dicarboxylate transporter 2/3/5